MTHLSVFSEYRVYLLGLAQRILGSARDAEDLLQETYLRWQQTSIAQVRSPKAFLTVVLRHLCINHLNSAHMRREEAAGPSFPEAATPGTQTISDGISSALLILLERLSPKEQVVLLLKDVFDYDYEEIAPVIKKSADNCRQLLRRARQHIISGKARYAVSPEKLHSLVQQFATTCAGGDLNSLVSALA